MSGGRGRGKKRRSEDGDREVGPAVNPGKCLDHLTASASTPRYAEVSLPD